MRLTDIRVTNFLNHKDTTIDLNGGRVHTFEGNCGEGKSAILDAVRWVLSGYTRGMKNEQDRAREWELRGTDGPMEASVTLDGRKIARRRTKSDVTVKINGDAATQADVLRLLDVKEASTVHAALAGESFLAFDPKQRLKMLLSLSGANATAETVKQELIDAGVAEKVVDLGMPAFRDGGFDALARFAVTKRQEAKREAKAAPDAPKDEEVSTPKGDRTMKLSEVPRDKLSAQIEALEDALTDCNEKVGAAIQSQQFAESLKAAEAELAEAQAAKPADASQDKEQLAVLQVELLNKGKELEAARADIPVLTAEARALNASLASVDALEGECPTCSRKLSAEGKKKLVGGLKKAHDAAVTRHGEALDIVAPLAQAVAELRHKADDLQAEIADMESHGVKVQALTEQVERLRAVEIVDPVPLREEQGKITTRLAAAREFQNAVNHYDLAVKAWQEGEKMAKKWLNAAEAWDKVDKLCKPDKLPAKLTGDPVAQIYSHMNNYGGELTVTDDLLFTWHGVHESLMSTSEQYRLGWSIQEAIAKMAGLGIWFINGIDILDNGTRKPMGDYLLGSEHDTVLITQTVDRPRPPEKVAALAKRGLRFYWVERGTVINGKEGE